MNSYEDRELERKMKALADDIVVPTGALPNRGGSFGFDRAVSFVGVAALLIIAIAAGAAISNLRSSPGIVPGSNSAEPTPTEVAPQRVWQQLRATMPAGLPIIDPRWLPVRFQETSASASSSSGVASYAVTYHAGLDDITFSVRPKTSSANPPPPPGSSGIGTMVRRSPATLVFPSDLWSTPGGKGLRVVRWLEGGYELRIESETVTGDDLLHIAWTLDQAGAPTPAAPASRTKVGVCASPTSPEETVRRVIELIGGRDTAAIGDCFALEAGGYPATWANLPSATVVSIDKSGEVGGRSQVNATWRFASDPGGAWGPQPSNFFSVGLEDGVYRIFEVGTAGLGKLP